VQLQIQFEPSTSKDVVGYRLYRSDLSPLDFKQVGSSLQAGMSTLITDPNPFRNGAAIYTVAAVDVSGKESMSSELTIGQSQ
jgi:penicillin-binding protein